MATQSYGMASQIMLCPDICPCNSNFLFLTLGEEREYRTSSITPLKFKMQSHMTNGIRMPYTRAETRHQ
jgi:hypothetical protein